MGLGCLQPDSQKQSTEVYNVSLNIIGQPKQSTGDLSQAAEARKKDALSASLGSQSYPVSSLFPYVIPIVHPLGKKTTRDTDTPETSLSSQGSQTRQRTYKTAWETHKAVRRVPFLTGDVRW